MTIFGFDVVLTLGDVVGLFILIPALLVIGVGLLAHQVFSKKRSQGNQTKDKQP